MQRLLAGADCLIHPLWYYTARWRGEERIQQISPPLPQLYLLQVFSF